ncbi:bacteriophage tail sheath protein [Bergeriella denitrificans]|uniref:Bacteriophage tail sheath protein n=1 Tax=Bergeriella denitrificans TaxID=494 RepID=A0A378URN8_BERDE|nr:hypothetical protein [Bergeriella denitrificans]STZ83038.1 bacteriophage tail sheath protein [Bergeriella denitrificans]
MTHIKNFETAQRTGDLIDESIRRAELQYIDRPIDDALLDSLVETVRTYLGTLRSIVGFNVGLDYDYDLGRRLQQRPGADCVRLHAQAACRAHYQYQRADPQISGQSGRYELRPSERKTT